MRELAAVDEEIRERFRPLHWSIAYPHVAVKGGFDVVLSNPPWDKVKPNHNEFFSDYIKGYAEMEASTAKQEAEAFMAEHPLVAKKWREYVANIESQNAFYQNAYRYQTWKDSKGKALKGDANLFKVFLEKIFDILADNGSCGIVIPDNLNLDNGCTGLRHMLLENATLKELIMFENRKKLFDIHGQYKFDVLTFEKKKPRSNAAFTAGFYWYDPIWLEGTPDKEYIAQNEKNKAVYHKSYSYSVPFVRQISPDLLTIFEFKNENIINVFNKLLQYPALGDEREMLHIETFREFDMTLDSDLFNKEGKGWPLYQGKTIHHYTSSLNPVERFVIPEQGEARLAKKWKCDARALPDRMYRLAWRNIAQPTDTRSLICTIVPRGTFCGNSLNQALVLDAGEPTTDAALLAGVNAIMSSYCADMYIRQRIAKNVSAFILKSLPVPRDIEAIKELGRMSLPLFAGMEFDALRQDVQEVTDVEARNSLIAKLDARVAIMYNLSYEEYQAVLDTFPLVDEQQKKRCLLAYNDWKFSM